MDKVSFIIPARGESLLNVRRTVDSIYSSAKGEFEVIIGYDGTPNLGIAGCKNLKIIEFPEVVGIKTNINTLAAIATGKYLFKSDAHCRFGEGIDEILKANMEDDWVVMPRFKIICPDWEIQMRDGKEEYYDYFFIHCPLTDPRGYRFKAGGHWPERTAERENKPELMIDETPQIHGSGWFICKDHFFELGGFPLIDPYGHAQEPANLALKNWLMGGKVMVNKKTYYAHLHQETRDKGFRLGHRNEERTYNIIANHWMRNKESSMIHTMAWFVDEKFPNMPTWPANWKDLQNQYERNNP